MTTGTRVATYLAALFLLTGAHAETLVQWGESPSGAGTPGTNIVSVNQILVGSGTTYTGTTNNPAVGASYYPDGTGRSPFFSAAVSSITNAGGRLVEGAASGDRLSLYSQTLPAGGTYRGMFMWPSNYCLVTDHALTLTSATVVIIQRVNADTTAQGVHIVVRQGDSYYLSDGASFGSSVTTQSFALADRTWSAFTPFSAGIEVIGGAVSAPSFENVQAIGFYFTAQNGGAAAGACGANISYFMAEGDAAGGATFTLGVAPDDVQHGNVSPTGGVYPAGQPVVLTATASNYYQFSGWTGDLGGSTNPVTITMDADKTITATFAALLATNGVPLWWLAEYGLAPDDSGALSDNDEDGHAAWQEYFAGTLPNTATSVFRMASLNLSAPGPVLNWSSATGHLYRVNWSTNISSAFTAFADATALPATLSTYTDTLHGAEQPMFYRLETWPE